ncbi:hypothetical protein [Candidatus Lokiarchaeum ossiferum]|uniref:hypothetical protein n=1 Tax=Candidatus Lokiarchaeum ossiferum TaxID=2951803 RepID=UPI00352ECDFC
MKTLRSDHILVLHEIHKIFDWNVSLTRMKGEILAHFQTLSPSFYEECGISPPPAFDNEKGFLNYYFEKLRKVQFLTYTRAGIPPESKYSVTQAGIDYIQKFTELLQQK